MLLLFFGKMSLEVLKSHEIEGLSHQVGNIECLYLLGRVLIKSQGACIPLLHNAVLPLCCKHMMGLGHRLVLLLCVTSSKHTSFVLISHENFFAKEESQMHHKHCGPSHYTLWGSIAVCVGGLDPKDTELHPGSCSSVVQS